jgi:hypothetical protein
MGRPVQDCVQLVPIDRLFQAARPEEGINLERLAFNRRLNRRVMQQRNSIWRAQARQT